MLLVIDSLLILKRDTYIFKQKLCDERYPFSEFDWLCAEVIHRHTTRPFHYRLLYKGCVEREVIFGIPNPSLVPMLSVGIEVPDNFDFFAHLPKL